MHNVSRQTFETKTTSLKIDRYVLDSGFCRRNKSSATIDFAFVIQGRAPLVARIINKSITIIYNGLGKLDTNMLKFRWKS
ncbi:MAG: hypothetical protein WC180_05635 [Candidatus Paceibacterota bacterium]